MKKFKCCICHKEVQGYGNDPWPINNDPKAKCCDKCNLEKVVLARILITRKSEES